MKRTERSLAVVVMSLIVVTGAVVLPAQDPDGNVPEGIEPSAHAGENPVDLGTDPGTFSQFTVTNDCGPCFLGFDNNRYDFTLTTVEVADCCVAGDRFEVRFNDRNADEDGNLDLNNHEEDCIAGRQPAALPVGTFDPIATVTLQPGDYSVRVRDVAFQCDPATSLCSAGFDVRISFGPPTGVSCAALMSCMDLATADPSCQDVSGTGLLAPSVGAVGLVLLTLLLAIGGYLALRRRATPV